MVFFNLRRVPPQNATGKVVVFGATTVVGQTLSLLLKLCPHVTELCCCGPLTKVGQGANVGLVRGVAADLSHIDTNTGVRAFEDPCDWELALRGARLVLFCSGSAFDPCRAQLDMALRESGPELMSAMTLVAKVAPKAIIGVVSSPVNALVPLAREVLVRNGVFDPRKLLGVTSLDVIRTRTFVAEELQMNPFDLNVPVVGGRGGVTACPLVSQTTLQIPHERIIHVCNRVQSCGSHSTYGASGVACELKDEKAASVELQPKVALSLAHAVLEWSVSVLKALRGDRGIVECSFVESTMRKETPFFASRVELGEEGVARLLPLGLLTAYERELVETAVPFIAGDVEAGLRFAAGRPEAAL
ncbi:malate dehydrogenase [Trypanosoma rangeli]|uniref:malate dehydrogenase n=1 Tax=Trypanosoma rangeli TaxID=5698 RepID=A0A422N293_TRYRA|nr:malate dehydrogenase [Trypanosoma rangeli]RNE99563.1 malate dehydrogenase [Trypanosoma rangeli]|eukprot:RNE99563.1 malate dehydrogenase [Trypanosoma rangeli]